MWSVSLHRSRASAWRRSSADRAAGVRARLPRNRAAAAAGGRRALRPEDGHRRAARGLRGRADPGPRRSFRRRGRTGNAEGDRRGHGGAGHSRSRGRPPVRPGRGRGVRVGPRLARGARAFLRADDRARHADRHDPLPRRGATVKVWIDITAPAHVLVFRPLLPLLRERGAEVELTSRDYAQNVQLLELHGIEAAILRRHGGRSRLGALRHWAKGREFVLALAHGSHELTLTARRLRIPSSTTFDYEFAWLQHQLGCRAAARVVVPEAIPPERLERYGARPPKLVQYPGLKEEYYLSDFEPDPAALEPFEIDPARTLVVVRTPPDVSLYHRRSNPLFPQVLDHLGHNESVKAIVLPRTLEQRDFVRGLGLPSVQVPDRAVDGQSLIAFSDLVVSAGGTMNREAVALAVPVYTTYGGRLGGVDEMLIREGRLIPLSDPRALDLRKREGDRERARRDPALMLDLLTRELLPSHLSNDI